MQVTLLSSVYHQLFLAGGDESESALRAYLASSPQIEVASTFYTLTLCKMGYVI